MIVKSLTLKNFRNHDFLSYDFKNGINILAGPNGAGKTNVVEALYYLSLARSFRVNDDWDLIKKDKDRAEINAIISEGELSRKIRILICKDGRQVLLNNKPISRLSELSKCMNVVLFEPKDVMLFRGSPRARRNFLDISISKKYEPYLDLISQYSKLLKERNEILKSEKPDTTLLEITTEMMVNLSEKIVSFRLKYVKDINDILIKITRALTGEDNKIEVIYKPFVESNDEFKKNAIEAFKKSEESDLKKKATSIGIHREDISVSLNERDIGEFGSQGENRIAALALKLSPYFLIEDKDKRPIVALDDVMSELDQVHRQRLINFLKKFEQVFITATRLEVNDASHYQLKKKDKKEVF